MRLLPSAGLALTWIADDQGIRLPATPIRPVSAKDVATAVAEVAVGARTAHSARAV
ncbi:hypothetical protein ACFYZ3_08840 [Streptomyces sp. NPDC001599]|uniref:hypothetical protein n=1 Tax=Streptomyces sp. NPDC001599 TaxID=3364591 RepID=UPI0036911E26